MPKNPALETKEIWKKYGDASGFYRWILKKINLKLMEGEFISILGEPASGKSTLLKILSFLELPDRGEVYFQGRLVGKSGAKELDHMHGKRVRLIKHYVTSQQIAATVNKNLAAVLLDEPAALHTSRLDLRSDSRLLTYIRHLNSCGIAVVIATRYPVVASRSTLIYKLRGKMLEKLAGTAR